MRLTFKSLPALAGLVLLAVVAAVALAAHHTAATPTRLVDLKPAARSNPKVAEAARVFARSHRNLLFHPTRRSFTSTPRHLALAHATLAEEDQAFGVLRRAQTAQERNDPILHQIASHQPNVDQTRVRALDSGGTVLLMPTDDGQVCIGEKTAGIQVFAGTCGSAEQVIANGLSVSIGQEDLGVVPDGVDAVTVDRGSASRRVPVDHNVFRVTGNGGDAHFVGHDGKTHHLGL